MRQITVSPLLRLALRLDAALSVAAGALTLALPGTLAGELGAPASAVQAVGLFMLGYGVLAGALGACRQLPRWLVRFVVLGNTLWVLDSLLLLASGWISPRLVGSAILLAQAAAVAVLASLQGLGLQRSAALPA
jgi:hypothetical protein